MATVDYDLTALSGEAAASLARFAAHYPQFLQHWEEAIAVATSSPDATGIPNTTGAPDA